MDQQAGRRDSWDRQYRLSALTVQPAPLTSDHAPEPALPLVLYNVALGHLSDLHIAGLALRCARRTSELKKQAEKTSLVRHLWSCLDSEVGGHMVDYSNPTGTAGSNYIVAEEEGMHQEGKPLEVLAGRTLADHTVRKVQEVPYRRG